MKLSGSYQFDATAAKVWSVITAPEHLEQCIPGCEGLNPQGNGEYQTLLTVAVGPVRGKYNAKISMKDEIPPQSYRLVVEGSGSTGFLNGEAAITLVEENGKTTVRIDSDSNAGGPVARVGQRLMGSVGKVMMDRFFSCLQEHTR
jgi:carbon monoxide dehydrogenase subunit G